MAITCFPIGTLNFVFAFFIPNNKVMYLYFVYLFLCFSLYGALLEDGNFVVQVSTRMLNSCGFDFQGASAHINRSRRIENQALDCFVGQCHWSEATCQLVKITS